MNLKLVSQKQDYEQLVIKYRQIERIVPEKLDEELARSSRVFDVDREQSCDKRSMISPTSFGYLSLHIVCS